MPLDHEHPHRRSSDAPLGLDLYLWLTYRTFALRQLRCGSLGGRCTASSVQTPDEDSDKRNVDNIRSFREKVLRELKEDQAGLAEAELRDGSRAS